MTVEWKNGDENSAAHRTARAAGWHQMDGCRASRRDAGRSSPCRSPRPPGRDRIRDTLRRASRAARRRPRPCGRVAAARAASKPTLSAPARPSASSFRTTRRRSSSIAASISAVPSDRAVVDDDELEVRVGLAEHARTACSTVASASRAAITTDTSGAGHGGLRVACAGGGSRLRRSASTSSSQRSTAPTTLAALLDSLEAQTHRRFRLLVVDQNADGACRRARRHPSSRRPSPALGAGSVPGAERRRCRHLTRRPRRFPGRRLPVSRPTCSSASRSASRPTRASTASAAGRPRATATPIRRWPSASRRADAVDTLWNRASRTRSSFAASSSSASARSTKRSASARDAAGRRARRSTTSCVRCARAHGSSTTPSSSCTMP